MAAARKAFFSILLVTAAGVVPALWNGYPFLFYDSIWYFYTAAHWYGDYNRPTWYAFFLDLFLGRNPMAWVWIQAFMQAVVLQLVWSLSKRPPGIGSALLLSGLVVLTPMGFLTSLLMPDFSGGLLILLVGILLLFWSDLGIAIRLLCLGLVALFLVFHLSHLSILVALAGGWALVERLLKARFPRKEPFLALALVLLLSAGSMSVVNRIRWQTWSPSPHASLYLFARYYSAGPVRNYLVWRTQAPGEELPESMETLLERFPAGTEAQAILWQPESPMSASGPQVEENRLAGEIFRKTVLWNPFSVAESFLLCGFEQSVWMTLSDALVEGRRVDKVLEHMFRTAFHPDDKARFVNCRQQQGRIPYRLWDAWNYSLYFGGIAFLAFCLFRLSSTRRPWWYFSLFCLYGILVNGILLGGLSALDGRYQLRVSWIPVFCSVMWIFLRRSGDPLAVPPGLSGREGSSFLSGQGEKS